MYGGVNGLYIVIQDITEIQRERLYDFLKIDKTKFFWKIFSRIVVFLLIDFTWLFFRTENVFEAFGLLNKILKEFRFTFIFSDAFYSVFGTAKTYCILLGSILIVFVKDCLHYNKINLKNVIFQQQLFFRWSIYIIILLLIIFLGAYGMDYEQTQFIYFQF